MKLKVKGLSGRPRVVLLHNYVTPYRLPIFRELSRRVEVVTLFCGSRSKDRRWPISDDHDGTVLASVRIGGVLINPAIFMYLWKSDADVFLLIESFDTIMSTCAAALFASLRRKPWIIWTEHTELSPLAKSGLREQIGGFRYFCTQWAYRRVRRHLYRRASAILSMSGSYSDEELRALDVGSVQIVSSGQVMPSFDTAYDQNRRTAGVVLILFLGYFRPEKRADRLVEAFVGADRCGQSARLLLIGSGPEEQRLRAMCTGRDDITFLGYLEGREKMEWLCSADVLVVPSDHEPWGLVVNEALLAGTPVVVSDRVAASQLVDGTVGAVFPADDSAALRKLLSTIICDQRTREGWKEGARLVDRKRLGDPSYMVSAIERAIRAVL